MTGEHTLDGTRPMDVTLGVVAGDPGLDGFWRDVATYLLQHADLRLEVVPFADYETQIQALVRAEIDLSAAFAEQAE